MTETETTIDYRLQELTEKAEESSAIASVRNALSGVEETRAAILTASADPASKNQAFDLCEEADDLIREAKDFLGKSRHKINGAITSVSILYARLIVDKNYSFNLFLKDFDIAIRNLNVALIIARLFDKQTVDEGIESKVVA